MNEHRGHRWEDLLAATSDMDSMAQAGLLGRIAWHLASNGTVTVDDFLVLAGRQREQAERLPRLDLNQRPYDLRSDGDEDTEWVKLRRRASSPAGLQAIKHAVVLRDPGADPTLPS